MTETERASAKAPFFFGELLRGPSAAGGGGEADRDLSPFPDDQRERAGRRGFVSARDEDLVLVRKASLAAGLGIGKPDAHRGEHPRRQFFLHSELAQIGERVLDFAEGTKDSLRPFRSRAVNARAGNLKVGFAPTGVEHR